MLLRAREKNVYHALCRSDLFDGLSFPSASFAAVVSIGVFTWGHASAECVDELARVTRPGGVLLFSSRLDFFESSGLHDTVSSLESAGAWSLQDTSDEFLCFPGSTSDIRMKLWIYRLTS
jgi:SAM-dependent methyltransferase